MTTAEIESTNWESFCSKFLSLHRGALMSVTQVQPSGLRTQAVSEMPLVNIWFERGACNDTLVLNFEQQGKREVRHEIISPIHIKLREEPEGKKALQIDGENGSTLLLFRSGHMEELLKNV